MPTLTIEFSGLILFGGSASRKDVAVINADQRLAELPRHQAYIRVLKGTVTGSPGSWDPFGSEPGGYRLNQFGRNPQLVVEGLSDDPLDSSGWAVISLTASCGLAQLPRDWFASGNDLQKHALLTLDQGVLTSCQMATPSGDPNGPIVSRWTVRYTAPLTIRGRYVAQSLTFTDEDIVLRFVNTDTTVASPDDDLRHFKWYWWTTANANSCWAADPVTPGSPIPQCLPLLETLTYDDTPMGVGCSNSNYP